ncbi:hypothetical protein L6249_00275 [Candidatus Parcubacteria bacterium]|nr:hypothetical protein [Patescibacteria group bacterium]MCG2690498.1 hypothetical protein [Candidatus Parcubacteria bacterium]
MAKYAKALIYLFIFFIGLLFAGCREVQADGVSAPAMPAPTMIEPDENTVTGKLKPLIKGLTINGTFVRVYIDGVYNGKTDILTHDSGTANFAYQPFLNLSEGRHAAWAVAEDEASGKSGISNVLSFKIEKPMPAPTIFTPVINSNTSYNRPFIAGLAKNDSLIKIFIDNKLDGQFTITNHQSGAANFAYSPYLPLTGGGHLVYAVAIDNRGKESRWSNIVYFAVKQPAVAQVARAEEREAAAEIKEPESEQEEPAVVISPQEAAAKEIKVEELKEEETARETEVVSGEEKTEAEGKIADEEIQKIIAEGIEKEKPKEGLINEDKEKQSKLNLNLIIFIVFLLAVAGWIFWVNRELIKEKRKQAENEEDKTNKPIADIEEKAKDENKDNLFPPQEQPPLI